MYIYCVSFVRYRHTITAAMIVVSGLINPGPGFLNVKDLLLNCHLRFGIFDWTKEAILRT